MLGLMQCGRLSEALHPGWIPARGVCKCGGGVGGCSYGAILMTQRWHRVVTGSGTLTRRSPSSLQAAEGFTTLNPKRGPVSGLASGLPSRGWQHVPSPAQQEQGSDPLSHACADEHAKTVMKYCAKVPVVTYSMLSRTAGRVCPHHALQLLRDRGRGDPGAGCWAGARFRVQGVG